jgi:Peptidase M50B-like
VTRAVQPAGVDKSFVKVLVISCVAVAALWWTPLLFPFRLLVTTVHEICHAIAVMATGGTVQGFGVDLGGSGVVQATGGSPIVVYSAGYLGSTLFGGTMLLIAKHARGRRTALRFVAGATAAVIAVAGLLRAYRNGSIFDLVVFNDLWAFGIVMLLVAALLVVAAKAPDVVVGIVCLMIAVLSVLYAAFDLLNVFSSTISPLGGFNDARGLAAATGVPAVVWAGLWCVVGAVILWKFVRASLRPRIP